MCLVCVVFREDAGSGYQKITKGDFKSNRYKAPIEAADSTLKSTVILFQRHLIGWQTMGKLSGS